MKLPIAASVLISATSATAESRPDPAGESIGSTAGVKVRSSHRNLVASIQHQHDISTILKNHRVSKKESGIIRNLQNKLKRSELRNRAEEDGDVSDADLDVGFFSRNLQQNLTDTLEESVIEELVSLCSKSDAESGFSCSCSNVDVDAYTANVICSYNENCLDPTPNACGGDETFCFVETYELQVDAPGMGSSKVCYEVNSPMSFSYCYGLQYSENEASPSACFLEVDGKQCSSCEFTFENTEPDTKCNDFDCINVDAVIASGTVCGNETVVSKKIEDFLVYGALPCEGGCNICPKGGEMMNLANSVALITGEEYYCFQLNLAALMGYLQNVPGDLCNALPAIVNGPCECTSDAATTLPVVDTISDEAPVESGIDASPAEKVAETSETDLDEGAKEPNEEAPENFNGLSGGAMNIPRTSRYIISTVMALVSLWVMA